LHNFGQNFFGSTFHRSRRVIIVCLSMINNLKVC